MPSPNNTGNIGRQSLFTFPGGMFHPCKLKSNRICWVVTFQDWKRTEPISISIDLNLIVYSICFSFFLFSNIICESFKFFWEKTTSIKVLFATQKGLHLCVCLYVCTASLSSHSCCSSVPPADLHLGNLNGDTGLPCEFLSPQQKAKPSLTKAPCFCLHSLPPSAVRV